MDVSFGGEKNETVRGGRTRNIRVRGKPCESGIMIAIGLSVVPGSTTLTAVLPTVRRTGTLQILNDNAIEITNLSSQSQNLSY
jgi:hypothetical protein